MLSILVSSLFFAAALTAIAAIAVSVVRFGPAWLALRDQLASCQTRREMRWQLVPAASCQTLTAPLPRWRDKTAPARAVRTAMPPVRPQAARRAAA